MIIINHGRYDFEKTNKAVIKVMDQIAAEGQASKTHLYIVSQKFSSTIRIALIAGSMQDDHDMLWYFHLGNDLDNRRIDFDFHTADILAVLHEKNDFIWLKN